MRSSSENVRLWRFYDFCQQSVIILAIAPIDVVDLLFVRERGSEAPLALCYAVWQMRVCRRS